MHAGGIASALPQLGYDALGVTDCDGLYGMGGAPTRPPTKSGCASWFGLLPNAEAHLKEHFSNFAFSLAKDGDPNGN